MSWLAGQKLGKKKVRELATRKCRKWYAGEPHRMDTEWEMWRYLFSKWVPTKGNLLQRRLSINERSKCPNLWMSVFPSHLPTQWVHVQSDHGGRYGDYAWTQLLDFRSTSLIWLLPLKSAQTIIKRDQQKTTDMAPFPGETSQLPGGRLVVLDCSVIKRSVLFSCRDTYKFCVLIYLLNS